MHKRSDNEVKILDGSTFFVSDSVGDAHGNQADGLFFRDTRFLSAEVLRINGRRPTLLSTKEVDYFSERFFLTMPFVTVFESHPISIVRSRLIGSGASEQILLQNNSDASMELMLTLRFDTDFADLLEVKADKAGQNKRQIDCRSDAHGLTFTYTKDKLSRQTIIQFSESAMVVDRTAYFRVKVDARQEWKVDISIVPVLNNEKHVPKYHIDSFGKARPEMEQSMHAWLNTMPELRSDMDYLVRTYNRTIVDLAALRFRPGSGAEPVLAAGLPWYMALFGRDNLITSYQSCFAAPELGKAALLTLAKRQGTEVVDFRDEEPGKILHELRFGELTETGKLPYSPYYGAADSTPLFLILLNEVYTWTADKRLVRSLEQNVRRALDWINRYGDADGDGYVEFKTKSSKGLKNQCWKDSWNSMLFANGRMAEPPVAVAEIQGYVYDAKMKIAFLAETIWNDKPLAEQLRKQAAALKQNFNRDYWIDKRGGYFALALDKDKKQVDSCTSNMGQLLWSGIVDEDRAAAVVKQLFSDEMYSGWGIRTMSRADAGFNPITYHNGTVWPHDNSLIAAGLARYGYRDEANRVLSDLIEASHYFNYRLPEVFAGFQRARIDFPVEYPTACSPQAWASGTAVLLMRTALGLTADPLTKTVQIDGRLPNGINQIDLQNLRLFGDVFHVHVDRKKQYIVKESPKRSAAKHMKQYRRAAG